MADRYTSESRLVSIAVKGMDVRYGFRTILGTAESTVLGHGAAVDANGVLLSGVILGANSPKPPRASKKRASGETDSSFVGSDKIADARTAGWKITSGGITVPRATPLSIPVFVQIDSGSGEDAINYNYGWRMPKYQHSLIAGEFATLGIVAVTNANYQNVWFGVNKPKPARAAKDLDNNSSITTFVSSAREGSVGTTTGATPAASGWYLVGNRGNRIAFGV